MNQYANMIRSLKSPEGIQRLVHLYGERDGMLVEQLLAKPVKLVEGSYRNLKITTEEDMKIAEALYDPAR